MSIPQQKISPPLQVGSSTGRAFTGRTLSGVEPGQTAKMAKVLPMEEKVLERLKNIHPDELVEFAGDVFYNFNFVNPRRFVVQNRLYAGALMATIVTEKGNLALRWRSLLNTLVDGQSMLTGVDAVMVLIIRLAASALLLELLDDDKYLTMGVPGVGEVYKEISGRA